MSVLDKFNLTGRVAAITGGGGLLGIEHAAAIASAGGIPVLLDVSIDRAGEQARAVAERYGVDASALATDVTDPASVDAALVSILRRHGRVDILINNAANNPKVEASGGVPWSRLEQFPLRQWEEDLAVGLTGAFLCAKTFGTAMAERGGGAIVNVASDLAIIAPDQRLYRQPGLPADRQPVKPVTYSVVKTGLIGLTRYLATYWSDQGVRVNAVSPGGVLNAQPDDFVRRVSDLIPLGRMAHADEYQGTILFLCSDASSYMTGANVVVDGGRSVW